MDKSATLFPIPEDISLAPVDVDGVAGEWIAAPDADHSKVLLYLHGGGYVMGSIDTHRDMIARISRESGVRALAINYRLAPEHRFPACQQDALTAYAWLLSQGIASRNIVIGGDSAGGGLTLSALAAIRDAGDPLPAAAVVVSPWTDMTATAKSLETKAAVDPMVSREFLILYRGHLVGDGDPRAPGISPLFGDLKGFPPILIQVGSEEVLLDDSTGYAEAAKAAGVDITLEVAEDMIHVWHWFAPMIPEGREAIGRLGAYIKGRIA